MAGIAGSLDLCESIGQAETIVRGMLATLTGRGPGAATIVHEGPATLGVRPLPVLDGVRPVTGYGTLRLVLDGDIVNCLEVSAALRSRGRPVDGSQAATVLAAWAEWGPACLDRLEGGFALALWNTATRRLHCVRDRLGVRPLYYTVAGGRFRFGSEIKALLADGAVPREPNDRRILQYLAYGLADHTDQTMLRGILQVPGAGHLIVSPEAGVESVERWYRLRAAPADGPTNGRVRALLEDAVGLRLRGRGVVGATLSGGLDSSTVLAVAASLRRRDGLEPPLAIVARTADPRVDEWPYAELLLRRHGIASVQVRLDADGLVRDFDAFAHSLDEPCHSPSVYGHWRVMQAAREAGVDVVLEGQMGERFGALEAWYPTLFYDMLRRGHVDAALRELVARCRVAGVPVSRSLLDLGKLLLPARLRAAHRTVPPFLRLRDQLEPPEIPGRTLLAQQLYTIATGVFPLVAREVDRDSAAFSLAERAPFEDTRLVEYALSLPPETLHVRGHGKAPVIEAMRGLVPDTILDRPTKQGFTVDSSRWLAGAFGAEVERTFRSEAASGRPYWNAAAVRRTLDACRGGARADGLWRAYSVERWLERVVDRTPAST